ncbi:acetyltransferase [Renibacterium salmoninarum ATCC 33209]|uniref:Acetyltransferase n=1 Tax=Renibacterium salmoninarum (strain ATCC 33209 / DSM 20767 / JCM 11484 / NBRC 15589 / NCIMB 2235) TaxID=288705 RepID=A9WP42_RENSM|nr:acetyltransferase [Renibacterium salmoninarum ATCC 33209]
MEFKIRPARAEDYEKLPEIETAADAVINMVGLPEASSLAEYRQGKFVAVAQRSGRLCGLARVDEVDGQAHLEQISVLPSDSGQGIGRALVETAKTLGTECWLSADDAMYLPRCIFQRAVLCAMRLCSAGRTCESVVSPASTRTRTRS